MHLWIVLLGIGLSLALLYPLARRWQLQGRIAVPAALLIGLGTGLLAAWMALNWELSVVEILLVEVIAAGILATTLLLWRFYRDPERIPPDSASAILSPADGLVIYTSAVPADQVPLTTKGSRKFPLTDFAHTDFFQQGGQIIGIAMNFLDVHVNRTPIGGTVQLIKRIHGRFLSLKRAEALLENERVLSIVANERLSVGVLQISSRLVRKIVSFVHEQEPLRPGQRIGMIRFGSQVDVYLPAVPTARIRVKPGDRVKAGESILAELDPGMPD